MDEWWWVAKCNPLGWTAPHGISCAKVRLSKVEQKEPSMNEITRVAVDTSKAVFTLHCVDASGRAVLRRNLRRADFVAFFAKLPPVQVAMEACGASHHWARTLQALGHAVRLIPPQYVKPFVKRGKNDRNDAEAISEAAARPDMRHVPVKSAAAQAQAMLLSVRDLLVRQRTQLVNALRGHAAEMGLVAAKGDKGLATLRIAIAQDEALPALASEALGLLGGEIDRLEARLAGLDAQLMAQAKANADCRRLTGQPGIGPIGGLNFALRVDATQFRSGRHFAAWLGLVPREQSTGGKQRLGGISRAGDERLRQLLVLGATSVIRHAKPGRPGVSPWLLKLLERKPRKLAAVALANKMARIVWAMLARGEEYRQPTQAAA
jgi:transposase